MEAEDELLLLAAEACEPAAAPEPQAAPANALEDADLFLDLAAAADAAEEGCTAADSGSGKAVSGPRLSWAGRAAAAGTAGALPPDHQPRQAVLLPPGAIPRVAPPPPQLVPGQQSGLPGRGVALFGAPQGPAGGMQRGIGAGSAGSGSGSTFSDVGQGTLVERHAGLKIKNPRVSHTQLRGRLADTAVLRLAHVKQRHRTAGLEGSWATIAVVGEKSKPRETATGRTYSIWKVTDLDQTGLSLFLFGAAHDDLWREPEGTIVALFTPKVRAEGDFSLSVDSAEQIWVLGQSPEFGYCKAKKKNGEPCHMPVNVARCPFCPYHVQSEYNKMKPTSRNEFQTSNLKTAFRPGMQRGLQWAPGDFESTAAKQPRIKQLGAAQLDSLAASARDRGSAAGARYLSTVANPAAAAAAEAAAQRKLTPAAAIAEAAQRGATAAALAAAPIPAGRTGGALVLQLPRQGRQAAALGQGQQKRKADESLGAGFKRRGSGGGGGGGAGCGGSSRGGNGPEEEPGMVELEDGEEEWAALAPAGGSGGGTAGAAHDPTADARARALALLRSAGVLEEAAAAAARGTRYKDLVDDEEHAQLEKVMTALEQKDEAAAKMDSITKLAVQAFKCKVCGYLAERRRPECAAHPYAVERVQASKKWWQCEGCKYRFTTVGQKYPSQQCAKCNQPGTHFTAVSMLRPKKEYQHERQQSGLASRDQLMARGNEQKWCNSW
ncbi:hypothetical protein ABPG75_004560 [Micractinium tetrahymenae]